MLEGDRTSAGNADLGDGGGACVNAVVGMEARDADILAR